LFCFLQLGGETGANVTYSLEATTALANSVPWHAFRKFKRFVRTKDQVHVPSEPKVRAALKATRLPIKLSLYPLGAMESTREGLHPTMQPVVSLLNIREEMIAFVSRLGEHDLLVWRENQNPNEIYFTVSLKPPNGYAHNKRYRTTCAAAFFPCL
jgi:hypothetical protein